MLKLFILRTSESNRSVNKTVASLSGIKHRFSVVENIEEINKSLDKTGWYLVLYDNECLSEGLRGAIEVIISMEIPHDALIFLEADNGRYHQSPRLFKKHVKLSKDSLMPKNWELILMERILDGWIFKHGI